MTSKILYGRKGGVEESADGQSERHNKYGNIKRGFDAPLFERDQKMCEAGHEQRDHHHAHGHLPRVEVPRAGQLKEPGGAVIPAEKSNQEGGRRLFRKSQPGNDDR